VFPPRTPVGKKKKKGGGGSKNTIKLSSAKFGEANYNEPWCGIEKKKGARFGEEEGPRIGWDCFKNEKHDHHAPWKRQMPNFKRKRPRSPKVWAETGGGEYDWGKKKKKPHVRQREGNEKLGNGKREKKKRFTKGWSREKGCKGVCYQREKVPPPKNRAAGQGKGKRL